MPNYSPGSDVTAGGWVAVPAVGGPVYAAVDEEPAVDTDYARSAQSPSGDTLEVKYTGVINPGVQTGHVIRYRIRGDNGTSITVSFVCGATVIKQWVHAPAPLGWTEYDQALTQGEAAAISDYSDLRLRLTGDLYSTAIAPSSAYRNGQPYLFQTVRYATEPNRVFSPPADKAGVDLPLDGGNDTPVAPTHRWVDPSTGWKWDNQYGDWIDLNKVRNAAVPTPWFSIPTSIPGSVQGSCTAALQYVQAQNRWNAYKIQSPPASPRIIAGLKSANPPFMSVTYVDGTQATLNCRITAVDNSSSEVQNTQASVYTLPVFMEFDRPRSIVVPGDVVQSATINITVTAIFGGVNNLQGLLIDPPINTDGIAQGIAATYSQDIGLYAHPSMIGVHRYVDGANYLDYIYPVDQVISGEEHFDPSVFPYRGLPQDTTKLPWICQIDGAGGRPAPDADAAGTRWVNTYYGSGNTASRAEWTLIPSTYTGDGFTPLAPGIGAMRIMMHGNLTLMDGDYAGVGLGYSSCAAELYLPANLWGIDTLFVRYYVRFGTPSGSYRMPMSRLIQQVQYVGSAPVWTGAGGKCGIMPNHETTFGGVSGTSGGGEGWQIRNAWHDVYHDDKGPDLGGVTWGVHLYDYGNNNPPGYRYTTEIQPNNTFGQRGGLGGMLYADRWYCVEAQVTLNSINPADPGYQVIPWDHLYTSDGSHTPIPHNGSPYPNPSDLPGNDYGFVPNGELRYWIDGRKVFERTGMVFRTNPVYDQGFKQGDLRATANAGHRNLLFAWYHGGTTQNTIDRSIFISQLAWGTQYIGPMAGASVSSVAETLFASDQCSATIGAALPSYLPAPGEVAVLNVANLGLTNTFDSQVAPNYSFFWMYAIRDGDSGAVVNPYWGTYGATICHGAGHSSSNDNSVIVLEYGLNDCTFKRLTTPPPLFGSGTDSTTKYNNQVAHVGTVGGGAVELRDFTYGEYKLCYTDYLNNTNTAALPVGQKCSSHTYGAMDIIPPANGGAANGTLVTVISVAQGNDGQCDSTAAHKVDFPTSTGAIGSYSWARVTNNTLPNAGHFPVWSQFVPVQNRIYYEEYGNDVKPRYFDLTTNTYGQSTGTSIGTAHVAQNHSIGGVMLHVPERNLLIFAKEDSGTSVMIKYMSVAATDLNPSWSAPILLSQTLTCGGYGWGCLTWCPDNGKLILGSVLGEPSAVFEIDIPAVLTNTWIVTRVPFGAGQSILWPVQNNQPGAPTYKSWTYNPKTKSIMYFPWAANPNQVGLGPDVVYVYRPRGT